MMARMPGAVWQGEHGSRAMSRYDIVCLHTIVGFAPAHAAHFSVRADGTILQSRDTQFRSGANLEGNPRVIAIENEDHGSAFGAWNTADGHAVPDFTPQQIEANAKICAWVHQTHGVPLVACPDSQATSRGVGYHRQGIDGNFLAEGYAYPGRVPGGEVWTTSPGKVCPGDRRISRRPQIIARAIAIAGGDEDMTPEEHNMLAALHFGLAPGGALPFSERGELTIRIRRTELGVAALENVDPAALAAELAPLIVAELPDPTTLTEQQMQDAVLAALTGQPLIPTPVVPA